LRSGKIVAAKACFFYYSGVASLIVMVTHDVVSGGC